MSRELEDLAPNLHWRVRVLLSALALLGYRAGVSWTLRSDDEQAEIFEKGRTRPGEVVTNRKGGESTHNYGLAADVYVMNPERPKEIIHDGEHKVWALVGAVAENLDLEWGGRWSNPYDPGHVQLYGGTTRTTLRAQLREHGVKWRGRA